MKKQLLYIFIIITANVFCQDNNVIDMPKSKIYMQVGYSNWNTSMPDNIQDFLYEYIKGLSEGLNFTTGYRYKFSKDGFYTGFEYSYFGTFNQLSDIQLVDDDGTQIAIGNIHDLIRIHFIGAGFGVNLNLYKNTAFFNAALYPGYYYYKDAQHVVIYNYNYKGQTIGYKLLFGGDIFISSHFSMGFHINYSGGKIYELLLDDETITPDKPENMERFDYNIEFGYNF